MSTTPHDLSRQWLEYFGAAVAQEVTVPLMFPHDVGVHDGNLNEAIRVAQL